MTTFGVAKNFRKQHGEEAFNILAKSAFADADRDGSGTIDTTELRTTLQQCGITLNEEQLKTVLVRYDADNSGMIDESEWLVLISDLIDGTFSPTAGAGSPTKASPGGGSYQPNYGAGDTSTEAQLIAEVQSLRAANGALEARVGILEAQMRQLLGGGPVVGARYLQRAARRRNSGRSARVPARAPRARSGARTGPLCMWNPRPCLLPSFLALVLQRLQQ